MLFLFYLRSALHRIQWSVFRLLSSLSLSFIFYFFRLTDKNWWLRQDLPQAGSCHPWERPRSWLPPAGSMHPPEQVQEKKTKTTTKTKTKEIPMKTRLDHKSFVRPYVRHSHIITAWLKIKTYSKERAMKTKHDHQLHRQAFRLNPQSPIAHL